VFPDEDVGYKGGVNRSYISKYEALLDLEETPATFEQILHILEMGVESAAASQDGSGSGYVYVYPFNQTSDTGSVKSYTVEGGDNSGEEEFAYGFCTDFTLSGVPGEAVMMQANIVGRQVSTGTFTSTTTATIPTVEEILFGKGKIYIDGDTVTWGNTQKTSFWRGFEFRCNTGWEPQYTGDGSLYFTFAKNVGPEIRCDITMEHNADAITEIAAWRARTARKLRLIFEGTAFTTAGTSFTYKTLRISMVGSWEDFTPLDDMDGDDVVTGTFRVAYDPDAAAFCEIYVVPALAAVQ